MSAPDTSNIISNLFGVPGLEARTGDPVSLSIRGGWEPFLKYSYPTRFIINTVQAGRYLNTEEVLRTELHHEIERVTGHPRVRIGGISWAYRYFNEGRLLNTSGGITYSSFDDLAIIPTYIGYTSYPDPDEPRESTSHRYEFNFPYSYRIRTIKDFVDGMEAYSGLTFRDDERAISNSYNFKPDVLHLDPNPDFSQGQRSFTNIVEGDKVYERLNQITDRNRRISEQNQAILRERNSLQEAVRILSEALQNCQSNT